MRMRHLAALVLATLAVGLAGSTSAFAQDELAAVMRIESGDQPALEME